MCTLEYTKVHYPQETGEKYIKLPFCSGLFPVFDNYDDILRIMYGDYMKLPPKEKQIYTHNPKEIKL